MESYVVSLSPSALSALARVLAWANEELTMAAVDGVEEDDEMASDLSQVETAFDRVLALASLRK